MLRWLQHRVGGRCSSHGSEAILGPIDHRGTGTTEPADPGWERSGAHCRPGSYTDQDTRGLERSLSGGGPGRGGRHGVPHQTAVCSRRVGWCPAGPGPGQSGFRKLDDRIVNVSVVVATAVNGEGKREIIGMDVGTSEDGAFWLAFLRSLSAGGLGGVELVVSDVHQGLRGAIAAVFGGATWQRCRTHFMTNLLTRVPRGA